MLYGGNEHGHDLEYTMGKPVDTPTAGGRRRRRRSRKTRKTRKSRKSRKSRKCSMGGKKKCPKHCRRKTKRRRSRRH